MSHTYEELKKKTVADLREIAAGLQHEAVQGYTQLNKDHLLKALCTALNIKVQHRVVGEIDKSAIKKQIKELKVARDTALAAKDQKAMKKARGKIHSLKRELRRAIV